MTRTFRDALLQAFERSGRSISDLSGASGVPYDQIKSFRQGKSRTINVDSAMKIAAAFGLTLEQMMEGDAPAQDMTVPIKPSGLAEETAPYTAPGAQEQAIRALFAPQARHPQILVTLQIDMPGIGMAKGDLIVMDLGREPEPGEIAAITSRRDGPATTILRRFLPPWLLAGDATLDNQPLRADDPQVTLRYPVIGLVRGLKSL